MANSGLSRRHAGIGMVSLMLLCAVSDMYGDGLPNEYALTQRWRELFMLRSPLGNPAWLTETDHVAVRGAFAPTLQGSFNLWELGVSVPVGLYHALGLTWVGEHAGDIELTTFEPGGRIVTTGETYDNTKSLFMLSYGYNVWRRLSVGANVNLAYESNFGDPAMGLGLDLGVSWRLCRHPLLGEHLVGFSTLNLLAPAMSTAPVPTFADSGAHSRGLKLSWYGRFWEGRIESGIDFDLKDFFAHSSEFASADGVGGWIDEAKELEWVVSWRIGGWVLRIVKLYLQMGFDKTGLDYWGLAGGVEVPSVNRGRDLTMLYQYNLKTEEDRASTHTMYAYAELGRSREELYARRLARLLNISPSTLYNRALELYSRGRWWDAFFVFGQLRAAYPDFFKMDWVSYYMGSCQEMLDMRESSANRYRAVVRQFSASPVTEHAALGLMRIAYREGDFDGVRGQYTVLARNEVIDSLRHHAEYLMGQSLLNKGDNRDGLEILLKVPYTHPDYVFARHSVALAYLRLGLNREALLNLDEIMLSRSRTGEQKEVINRTCALVGFYFYEEQQLSKAVLALRMVPENSYYYVDALLGLGWCALKAQQWSDCVEIGRKLRQTATRQVLKAEAVVIEAYGYLRMNRLVESAALLSSAYNMVQGLEGPSVDSVRVRREMERMTRVVYDSLAEETNRQALMEPVPVTVAIVNKMRARQGELERPLREWPRWHDEFVRSGYFARSVDKIREDVEYLYAFVRKKVSLGKDIQEGLELLQKRRDIDADIDRLKKELEEMEKTGKQQDKGGAE